MNARHHFFALLGLRLRLDPDYPKITRIFPMHITDTVLEYRSYMLAFPLGLVLAAFVPWYGLLPLCLLWELRAQGRAEFYRSELAWWRQAYTESPRKTRTRIRYSEHLMTAINELYTNGGVAWDSPELQEMIATATRIQDEFVEEARR